jgi:hypothetical protein
MNIGWKKESFKQYWKPSHGYFKIPSYTVYRPSLLTSYRQYLSEYQQSSLICLRPGLWNRNPTLQWSWTATQSLEWTEASTPLSGKAEEFEFINEKYCNSAHITTKHQVCTKDIELLALNLQLYYLPQEINQARLFVYIAHNCRRDPWPCIPGWNSHLTQ